MNKHRVLLSGLGAVDSWAVCVDGSGDEKGGNRAGKMWREK